MNLHHTRELYVNLPVADLQRSMEFFSKLGFEFNPQFTDEKAACMVVNAKTSVMLLERSFFQTFTKREICDTAAATEGLFALSCDTRAEVDEMVKQALAAGGSPAMDSQDHDFMYAWSFYDLDGHHWEVLWMNADAVGKN